MEIGGGEVGKVNYTVKVKKRVLREV